MLAPAELTLEAPQQAYSVTLTPGSHWLPLVLAEAREVRISAEGGEVEHGPTDIVPSFLARDGALLQQLSQAQP